MKPLFFFVFPVALVFLFLSGPIARAVAPDDASASSYDPSMRMPAPVTVAPGGIAPKDEAPLTRADVTSMVAFALTALAYFLRRWSPPGHWMHSTQALAVVSTAATVLTVVAGVIAEKGLSVRAVVTAVIAWGTSAMAQSNASSPGVNAPPTAGARSSGTGAVPPAAGAVLLLFGLLGLGSSGCCAQLKDAVAKHVKADQACAATTKVATSVLRRADCDAACKEASLKVIDGCADAVPAVVQ